MDKIDYTKHTGLNFVSCGKFHIHVESKNVEITGAKRVWWINGENGERLVKK